MRGTTIFRTTALLTATALLAAGCGGGSDDDGVDAAAFSTSFTKATGLKLEERKSGGLTILRPESTRSYGRFGVFSIYVYEDGDARKRAVQSGDLREYDGGILLSSATGDRDPEVAQRLDQAMRAAVEDDPSLIPAAERACSSVGIDPSAGKEGTCRLPEKQLTVVDAGSELQTPALSAKLDGATTASELPPRSAYSDPKRARGRYVIVRFTVTNKGTEPLNSLRTNLVIGPNTYAESADSYSLIDYDDRPYPLQPGGAATLTTAYDLPEAAAAQALKEGAVELPAALTEGSSGYLSDREAVGRIRLSGAPQVTLKGASRSSSSTSSSSSGSTSSSSSSSSAVAAKRQARIRSAESALKEFYRALRKGNVRYVCKRLTTAVQQRFGGATACRQGRLIKATARTKAPSSTGGLRLTTVLTRNQTRALILVRGNGFSDAAKLARQDGLWRIQGTRKLTGG